MRVLLLLLLPQPPVLYTRDYVGCLPGVGPRCVAGDMMSLHCGGVCRGK